MLFPILKNIKHQFISVIKRFPYTLIMAVVGTVASICLVQQMFFMGEPSSFIFNVVITTILGFFFFLAAELCGERYPKQAMYLRLFCLALLAVYYYFLPTNYDDPYTEVSLAFVLRTILYGVAFVMVISFAPFIDKDSPNGFWQYNKFLFLRLFFTAIFSGALYLGLTLAFYSIDYLLGVHIQEEIYAQLWIFVVGIIASTFFLAGIPKDFSALEKEKNYPQGLRVFIQFILVPLLALYAFILYSYAFKILFTGDWPENRVATLILLFSTVGLITYALLYPLQAEKKNSGINVMSKLILILIIPMTGMLFWSISFRLSDYGLTINRYFVILAGIWILGMALYFLISKKKNLKLAPLSLFSLAFLSSFGPWGAISMSESNQINRIEATLLKNNLLVEGKVIPLKEVQTLTPEDSQRLMSAFEYLQRYGDLDGVQDWFEGRDDLDSECLSQFYCLLEKGIGVYYGYNSPLEAQNMYNYFYVQPETSTLDISGYDALINNIHYYGNKTEFSDDFSLPVKAISANHKITITVDNVLLTEFDISDFLKKLAKKPITETKTQAEMTLMNEKAKLVMQNVSIVNLLDEKRDLESFDGVLMFKK